MTPSPSSTAARSPYYPEAFSLGSRGVLQRRFPDAILASGADAVVLGLNAVSDGRTSSCRRWPSGWRSSCASAATCRSAWT